MQYYAVISGICAASASLFGKLAGTSSFNIHITLSICCFILMILFNVVMWTYFSKALAASSNSVIPTVTTSGVNYIFSAILGAMFFGEIPSLLWWISMLITVIGLFWVSMGNVHK